MDWWLLPRTVWGVHFNMISSHFRSYAIGKISAMRNSCQTHLIELKLSLDWAKNVLSIHLVGNSDGVKKYHLARFSRKCQILPGKDVFLLGVCFITLIDLKRYTQISVTQFINQNFNNNKSFK